MRAQDRDIIESSEKDASCAPVAIKATLCLPTFQDASMKSNARLFVLL